MALDLSILDSEYDVCILGTGLKESILSGILSSEQKKVLHIDVNDYYGGECASITLEQLYQKFGKGAPPAAFGKSRDWSVDLAPKLIMSCGLLVKILVKTQIASKMDFKSVDGSFVVQDKKIYKVPSTATEALSSSLLGFFEKTRVKNFLEYVGNYEVNDPKTHKGRDLRKMTARALFKDFSLSENVIDFVGHAMGLNANDDYMDKPALPMCQAVRLYGESVLQYGNSPYIYPLYGLGELPQNFSRLGAVWGGVSMLKAPFEGVIFDANQKAVGVKLQGQEIKCKLIISDPSYFPDRVKKVGKVIRQICILSHPVDGTNNAESAQIIIPQRPLKRKNDIYVSVVSAAHHVAANGKYIAMVSTIVETANPNQEIAPAIAMLGKIDESFVSVTDLLEPVSDGTKDQLFISTSLDPQTHFEDTCRDVLETYRRITGHDFDLTPSKEDEQQQ